MKNTDPFPPGSLAVIAMPLGNQADLTARALHLLSLADMVACEDTRTARRLLLSHGIKTRLVSYHDWNEEESARRIIDRLAEGDRVAIISEAGTPCISDPGFDAVREARRQGYTVFPAPGPAALTAFLSVSGLPTDRFTFLGFPPNRPQKRKKFYTEVADRGETLVFYEAPHRLIASLLDALDAFGDREAALGREMTKPYEEFFFGPLSGIIIKLKEADKIRGEITWGITGASPGDKVLGWDEVETLARGALAKGTEPPKQLAKRLAMQTGQGSKEIYQLLLKLRDESN